MLGGATKTGAVSECGGDTWAGQGSTDLGVDLSVPFVTSRRAVSPGLFVEVYNVVVGARRRRGFFSRRGRRKRKREIFQEVEEEQGVFQEEGSFSVTARRI